MKATSTTTTSSSSSSGSGCGCGGGGNSSSNSFYSCCISQTREALQACCFEQVHSGNAILTKKKELI